MVNEFNDKDEQFEDDVNDVPAKYEDLVTEEPERDVDLKSLEVKTVTESDEEAPHTTDLKAILNSLTPKYPDERMKNLLQNAPNSRIFPENLIDKNYLAVISLIEEHDPTDDVDVAGIILGTQDILSIGFEGRGIIEKLKLAGIAHEAELEKISRSLFAE